MSFSSLLVHACRVDRGVPGMADRYGHEEKTWPPGDTVDCLIQSVRGQEIEGASLGGQVMSDVRIFLAPSVVLAEQDRITDVTPDHRTDTYDVQYVETWDYGAAAHKEILARAILTGEVSG